MFTINAACNVNVDDKHSNVMSAACILSQVGESRIERSKRQTRSREQRVLRSECKKAQTALNNEGSEDTFTVP